MGQQNVAIVNNDSEAYIVTLQRVQSQRHEHFGPITVYKMINTPYEYLMEYCERNIEGDRTLQQKHQFYQQLPKHKNVVKVASLFMEKGKEMCINTLILSVFLSYYNHTLVDLISTYRRKKDTVDQSALLYILGSLASLGKLLNHSMSYMGLFKADKIYVSPEGYIKVYPLHYQWFKTFSQEASDTLNPETQLKLKGEREQLNRHSIKNKKNDIIDLGLLMLQLIFLNERSYYYDQGKDSAKYQLVEFTLNQYLSTKNYHHDFGQLLRTLIMEPESLTYELIEDKVEQVRNNNEIKLVHYVSFHPSGEKGSEGESSRVTVEAQKEEKIKTIKAGMLVPGRIKLLTNRR